MDSTSVATTTTPNFGVFEQLANYGALGLVVLALGAVAWMMFKKHLSEKEKLQAKIERLEEELLKSKNK